MNDNKNIYLKSQQRRQLLDKRANLSQEYRLEAEKIICDLLISFIKQEVRCDNIASFIPINTEIDINPVNNYILESRSKIFYPRILDDENMDFVEYRPGISLVRSSFLNVLEPDQESSGSQPEVVIVPGLGYDKEHYRIGYGKGYYDKIIRGKNHGLIIFPNFFQLSVAKIKKEVHDMRVDIVIDEKGIRKLCKEDLINI